MFCIGVFIQQSLIPGLVISGVGTILEMMTQFMNGTVNQLINLTMGIHIYFYLVVRRTINSMVFFVLIV